MEAIGDDRSAYLRSWAKSSKPFTKREILAYQLGGPHLRPWVARIEGMNEEGNLQRSFIAAQKDWSGANGTGSRGIWLYYFLEPGLYEINHRLKWKRADRYFAWIVDADTLCKLTRTEAIEWLKHNGRRG